MISNKLFFLYFNVGYIVNNVTLCYSVSNILDCFFINKKKCKCVYCNDSHILYGPRHRAPRLNQRPTSRRPPPPASRHDAPFPNNAQEKSHVDDPDWSVVHNSGQNKAGIRLSDAPVPSRRRPRVRADMSSPPKEKIETKGGHLPAGRAHQAAVLLFFPFKAS